MPTLRTARALVAVALASLPSAAVASGGQTAATTPPGAPPPAAPGDPAPAAPLLAAGAGGEALRVRPELDVPVTAASGAVFLALIAGTKRPAAGGAEPTPEPTGFDSFAQSRRDERVLVVSDGILLGSVGVAATAAALDGYADGDLAGRVLLLAEAMAINGALTESAKWAFRRPRPYTRTERRGIADDDASFYSGHASHSAAALFFTARSLDLTSDLQPGTRAALYGTAGILTLSVAGLRVGGGMHYPTDVAVGALVGGSIGWLVPELHRSSSSLRVTAAPSPDGGASVAVATAF